MGGNESHLTARALLVGLIVGSLLCCSNMYFGLQSGWGTMGSLQSAILGYGTFKALQECGIGHGFTVGENVIIQTTSVATATMPFTAGFVSVIPALGMLTTEDNPSGPVHLSNISLILWGLALAFFGVFAAIPLRVQTIVKEKLRFPSGAATAEVIGLLHKTNDNVEKKRLLEGSSAGVEQEEEAIDAQQSYRQSDNPPHDEPQNEDITTEDDLPPSQMEAGIRDSVDWWLTCKTLLWSFSISFLYKMLAEWVTPNGNKVLGEFPVFSWIGLSFITDWGWTLAPQLGYVGQGMIMGPRTCASMLGGALAGFAVLGPIAKAKGWAPGPIGSNIDGATGWVLWISLAVMLGDSLTSLLFLAVNSMFKRWSILRLGYAAEGGKHSESGIPTYWWMVGLAFSTVVCTCILSWMFSMPLYQPLIAVSFAGLVALLAVRALGETDLNPASGIGKLSQLVFAVLTPGKVVPNIIAGAVAEAGAMQAGDMMQDFKTAHLLGVPPRPQFLAQLVGSVASVFLSVGAYALFTAAWKIPGDEFTVPTAGMWIDMARLFNGGSLPPKVIEFGLFGALLGVISVAAIEVDRQRFSGRHTHWIPSGIGFAVGMYVGPKYTLPRVLGSIAEQIWKRLHPKTHSLLMIIVASGLVLGEGTAAILVAAVKAIVGST